MEKHGCYYRVPEDAHGEAMDCCEQDDDGKYWITNGEYASQVNYCPFCGSKAPTQIAESEMRRPFYYEGVIKEEKEKSDE